MPETRPTRDKHGLAETLELVLDKGLVINADVVVSVGDTELLSVELRAALASFDTAAEYGLQFPSGTDTDRVAAAAGVPPIRERADDQVTLDDVDVLGVESASSAEDAEKAENADAADSGDVDSGDADSGGDTDSGDEEAGPQEVPEADDQD